jgi:type I restriction enzyme S subunit
MTTDYGLSEQTFDDHSGVPVLKMGDISNGEILLGGQKTVPDHVSGLPELFLEKGDLLYNRTNSADLVGKTGVYEGPNGAYTFASYLIRIRLATNLMIPRFLKICMNSASFRQTEIEPHLKQQCGQANVNGTIMRNMRVPIPPLAEQHRIVAKVNELMTLCDTLKARLSASQTTQIHLADTIVEQAVA